MTRKLASPFLACTLALSPAGGYAQESPSKVVAEFPATWLRWIHIAEPIFAKEHRQLDKYRISVIDEGDIIIVLLTALDSKPGWMGSSGSVPDFEVDIRKKDAVIVSSHYER